jgi:hypothetical protein
MSEYLKNFGMIIPKSSTFMFEVPDPNGVPIYAKCPANGPCACMGTCRKILGYDTNPEKVADYHADIERRNELLRQRINKLSSDETKNSGDGGIRTWTWEIGKSNT